MKLFGRMEGWAALIGVALAIVASAQPEQWLQYHTGREGRSYRWLELTTNPPPNVALPKLGRLPYFARWITPLDATGGRWLCFDRTRRSGPWNRVFVDSNGNGRLDDEQAVDAARTDEYSAYFDPLKFVFKGEDGPVTYHLVLRFMKYEEGDVRLLVSSGGYYDGKVDVGGKKRTVTLVDGNVNGLFNDISPNPSDCDRILVEGDKTDERYLGRLLEIDNEFFQVEVARDGAFLKIKKAANVALGQVRVPENISEFTVLGENGHFVRKPVKGELTLPVGKYRVNGWDINRKDDKGAAWTLTGYNFNEFASFQVSADKPTALEFGEPVQAALQVAEGANNQLAFNLRLQGQFGESIQMLRGGQRPRGPQLAVTSPDGSFRYTNTFEFG